MPRKDYIVTIGLEVHCQIKTASKMFCACPTGFGAEPNSNTCPVCLGLPGALPVFNQKAIEMTLLAGMLLGCQTPEVSKWDRKNYFYPDMPKNFQLSQYDLPLCLGGGVPLDDFAYPNDVRGAIPNPGKTVRLTRIHLEEDVAKSTHLGTASLVDFNRAGTPLMEIVSEPDIDSPEEAYAYLKSLQQILIYGDISDADMEKGQLRCDVNVSVRPVGTTELGAKIELKNLNSISAVRRALHFEIDRQCDELDRGIAQVQSTRRWDDDAGETQLMRTKEDAHDYRYFPEPDLPPIRTAPFLAMAAPLVPELPQAKAARFERDFQITAYDASVLASDKHLANYFEATCATASAPPKKIANFILNHLLAVLNEQALPVQQCPVTPATLRELLDLVEAGTLANNQAKEVFAALWNEPEKSPASVAAELGFEPADSSALDALIDSVIATNPDKVEQIRAGNPKLVNWLTGQVMKASQGKANPKLITDAILAKIG